MFHLPNVKNVNGQVVIEDFTYPHNQVYSSVNIVSGLSLSSIAYHGGKVEFSGTDRLNSITVKDPTNTIVKSFSFFHSEIANYNSVVPTLYLDSILMKGSTGGVYERYGLLYKTKSSFGGELVGKDAWGYSNATTRPYDPYSNAPSLIPNIKNTHRFYESCVQGYSIDNVEFSIGNPANTELADKEAAQRGILKRIVYPTGGYVDFDFESNQYKESSTGTALMNQMGLL